MPEPRPQEGAPQADPGNGNLVWLASYPKSGNTWLRAFLTSYSQPASDTPLLSKMADIATIGGRWSFDLMFGVPSACFLPDEIVELRALYHEQLSRTVKSDGSSKYFKTHDAFARSVAGNALYPRAATECAIYVVRNPLDVAVSWAAYDCCSIDEIVLRMSRDLIPLTNPLTFALILKDWSTHVTGWMGQTESPMLVLRYEDMLADPWESFRKVLDLLKLPLDPERFEASLAATSFSRLKAEEVKHGFEERPQGMASFFREGRSGQWQSVLTPAQVETLVGQHGPTMKALGYLDKHGAPS